MYFNKIVNLNNSNIPFIPVYLNKEFNNIIRLFTSKFNEFLYVNNEFIEEIKSKIILKKIFKNDIFFGYVGFIKDTKLIEESNYWKWNIILYEKSNSVLLDNILLLMIGFQFYEFLATFSF